jgi:hypothetical protein
MSDTSKSESSSTLWILIFAILVILKTTGYITCSWWIVTAPLWLPLLTVLMFCATALVILVTGFLAFLIWVKWFE